MSFCMSEEFLLSFQLMIAVNIKKDVFLAHFNKTSHKWSQSFVKHN